MTDFIKGKRLMVFVKEVDAESKVTYKSIALSTSHTLTLSASTTDLAVKTKDGAPGKSWLDSEIDVMSWSVSSESLVSVSTYGKGKNFKNIMDLYLAGEPVEIVFDGVTENGVPDGGYLPNTSATGGDGFQGYQGKALITSLTLNAPLDDNASYSVEFQGVGELKEYTAA